MGISNQDASKSFHALLPSIIRAAGLGVPARLRPDDGRQHRVLQLRPLESLLGTGMPILRGTDAAGRRWRAAPIGTVPD
jgi:hypothetical protein